MVDSINIEAVGCPQCVSCSVVSNSLQPHRLEFTRLLCPWDSLGKNIGVGFHSLLQGYPHYIKWYYNHWYYNHYVGVGHIESFPRDNFSPSLARERRLKHWRIGSRGAHLLQDHSFIHLTNINLILSLCQALGWEPGLQQGLGQIYTHYCRTYSLARTLKFSCVCSYVTWKVAFQRLRGSGPGMSSSWTSTESVMMMMMMITVTCIFYLKRWGHCLLSSPLGNVKVPFPTYCKNIWMKEWDFQTQSSVNMKPQNVVSAASLTLLRNPHFSQADWRRLPKQLFSSGVIEFALLNFPPGFFLLFINITILKTYLFLAF